jgi:hypothetical protein
VAAIDVTEVTQPLEEGLVPVGASGSVERQVAYASDFGRRLRLSGERRVTWWRHEPSEIRHLTSLIYRNESGG